MPTLHQRNRVVIFRVTPEEHSNLMSACVAAGGLSVSDFIRSELLAMRQADSLGSVVEQRFVEIDRKLSDLQALVKYVSECMTALNGD
jgi:hypothetical protein